LAADRPARPPASSAGIVVFRRPTATLYLLTPADGTVAAQAIVLMDALINRRRAKVAQ
jgi:hypothetical protein